MSSGRTFFLQNSNRGLRYRAHCLKVATICFPFALRFSSSVMSSSSCFHSLSNFLKNTKILSSLQSSSNLVLILFESMSASASSPLPLPSPSPSSALSPAAPASPPSPPPARLPLPLA
uniref:Uncharacterized protein n=1 Tax=Arundo donax TaxID=35708 RepID=A0A0A9DFJ4_ARUDO